MLIEIHTFSLKKMHVKISSGEAGGVLPQSAGYEFDPRRVHGNLSVPCWVYMRFPVPEHQN